MICIIFAAAPFISVSEPVSVQAAVATQKTQLKKIKGNYYAYENGKKLCNKWRTVKLEKAVTAIISERLELHIKQAYPAVENMEPLSEKSAIIIMDLIILDIW